MAVTIENSSAGAREDQFCPLCAEPTLFEYLHKLACCESSVCNDCIDNYVSYRIQDGQHLFPCPMQQCKGTLTNEVIDNFSTPAQKRRIELLKIDFENSATTRSCPNCSHVKSVNQATYQRMKKAKSSTRSSNKVNQTVCQSCNQSWCYFCYGPTHTGVSCQNNLDGNSLFNQWSKGWDGYNHQQNAYRCPKCGIPIQRDGGCPSMNCSKCSCVWCYNCGKQSIGRSMLLGAHSGDKWQVNACGSYTIFRNRKITKILRWFKVINEVFAFCVCCISLLLISIPLLPLLVFVVPPVLFLCFAIKKW